MQAAKRWDVLACRPCRPLLRPQRVRKSYGLEVTCRYATYTPIGSQRSNETIDAQSLEGTRIRPLKLNRIQAKTRPTKRLSPINDDEAIVSDSLAATLQAHRDQNASGVSIRRVNRAPNPGPDLVKKTKKVKRKGSYVGLELTRDTDVRWSDKDLKDYEGEARLLDMEWEIIGEVPRHIRLPWISALEIAGPSSERAQDRLSAEIQAAGAFLTPRKEEAEAAAKAQKELESHLQRTYPQLNLDLLGSRASGLAMPTSDLDLNIVLPSNPDSDPYMAKKDEILQEVYKILKWGDDAGSVVEISYAALMARVPIFAGIHVKTGLEIQLQCADGAYGSLETVKGLLAEHPNLRPLFKVLRHMIKLRGLGTGKGKMTSYPLLNMIAVVLKQNPQECAPRHLGLNLLKFLDFWTEGIDLYSTGVTHLPSPYVPGPYGPFHTTEHYFAREETAIDTISRVLHDPVGAKPALFDAKRDLFEIHQGKTDYRMILHDPANPRNDLGSGITQIKHVQATLIHLKQKLKQDMAEWDQVVRAQGQMKVPSLSLLRSLLEADYTLYNLERKRLVDHGRSGSRDP